MKNEHTYWNSKGELQAQYNVLSKLIPAKGECPSNRPKLELLRIASNAYYDLFNNGLCNRREEFIQVFGFDAFSVFGKQVSEDEDEEDMYQIDFEKINNSNRIELSVTKIITEAALEAVLFLE